MTVIEIVFAILLIIACIFIIAVVLMQESKQGMSNVISGGSSDNYFQKNSGRTREAKLSRITKVAAILVFVAAIAVNLITMYASGDSADNSGSSSGTSIESDGSTTTTTAAETSAEGSADASDTTAETTAAASETSADTTTAAETTTTAAAQ